MIVLDENLHRQRLFKAISAWYPGHVTSVTILRASNVVKDEAIPVMLRRLDEPTFVTINVIDFWRRIEPHPAYCIVTIDLPQERTPEIPPLLRRLLRLPEFRTKTARLGTVVRLTPTQVEYYRADRQPQAFPWPD